MSRSAACIDKGLSPVKPRQDALRSHVETIREVAATLDTAGGKSAARQANFDTILDRLDGDGDPIHESMADLMRRFRPGLFVGGDALDQVRDNLDLERWFLLPKGHGRRIHGHRRAGMRIVQEGPTRMLALDAHVTHPGSFNAEDPLPYRTAREPECQRQARPAHIKMPENKEFLEKPL